MPGFIKKTLIILVLVLFSGGLLARDEVTDRDIK